MGTMAGDPICSTCRKYIANNLDAITGGYICLDKYHEERAMDSDMCVADQTEVEQSRFGVLNDTLQNISGDFKQITKGIEHFMDRLVGLPTECPPAEKPLIEPSQPGLVGELDDKVAMLQRRVTELHEQLTRVDGKF